MFKYEEEINARMAEFDYEEEWYHWCLGDDEETGIKMIKFFFCEPLSSNARVAIEKHYKFTKEGLVKVGGGYHKTSTYSVPVVEMPCALSSADYPGLYFLGQIGTNPNGTTYYMVKIGCSETSIKNRVAQYASYNPMIYHNNISLSLTRGIKDSETRCHEYLATRAIGLAQKTAEWFYVDKETYFELCEKFADETFFAAVAAGRIK